MSASESEGEIIETENEKATTAQPNSRDIGIDRISRPTSSSDSSNISSNGRLDRRRSRSRSRSRSRTPRRNRSPRGAKRRREDDYHSDHTRYRSRQFRTQFETEARRKDTHRKHVSYADIDKPSSSRSSINQHGLDHREHRRDARHQTRSRSPYCHDRHGRNHPTGASREDMKTSKNTFGTKKNDLQDPTGLTGRVQGNQIVSFTSNTAGPPDVDMIAEISVQDEDALIEERRKRREALKAKFKGSETPLLVQALQLGNESVPTTPKAGVSTANSTGSASPSAAPASPATPGPYSAPESPAPFETLNEDDLANNGHPTDGQDAPEEPSAADYDPTLDMQEDKAREDKRHNAEQSSANHVEVQEDDKKVPLPQSGTAHSEIGKSAKNEFDMFADDGDDDDDMFAPASKTKSSATAASKVLTVSSDNDIDIDLRDNWDDPDGYYRFNARDSLDGRYRPQAVLGRGMFSAVFRAEDLKSTDKLVAVKIIRNNETMHKAGFKEIGILKKLLAADPDDKRHIIRLLSSFEHKNHLCMVFENLNMNLRDVLRKFGRDTGINLKAVRSYARQIFLGLGLLRKCEILHADIKPDNILISDNRNILKICDLGSASDASDNEITPYLVSRFYRAPEIILGMSYDYAIDMWSVGCTLFELCTGKILFTGRTNNQMLKAIMECRGKFTIKMLQRAEYRFDHFDDNLERFRSLEKDKITGRDVVRFYNFTKPTRDLKSRVLASMDTKHLTTLELKELNLFVDLLDKCLHLNPEKRIVPNEALRHAFLQVPKA